MFGSILWLPSYYLLTNDKCLNLRSPLLFDIRTPISQKLKVGLFDNLLPASRLSKIKSRTVCPLCAAVSLPHSLQIYRKQSSTCFMALRLSKSENTQRVSAFVPCLTQNQNRNKPIIVPMFSCRDPDFQNKKEKGYGGRWDCSLSS
jgi:hypothetical protein